MSEEEWDKVFLPPPPLFFPHDDDDFICYVLSRYVMSTTPCVPTDMDTSAGPPTSKSPKRSSLKPRARSMPILMVGR